MAEGADAQHQVRASVKAAAGDQSTDSAIFDTDSDVRVTSQLCFLGRWRPVQLHLQADCSLVSRSCSKQWLEQFSHSEDDGAEWRPVWAALWPCMCALVILQIRAKPRRQQYWARTRRTTTGCRRKAPQKKALRTEEDGAYLQDAANHGPCRRRSESQMKC